MRNGKELIASSFLEASSATFVVATQASADLRPDLPAFSLGQEGQRSALIMVRLQCIPFTFVPALCPRWQSIHHFDGRRVALCIGRQENLVTKLGTANPIKFWVCHLHRRFA